MRVSKLRDQLGKHTDVGFWNLGFVLLLTLGVLYDVSAKSPRSRRKTPAVATDLSGSSEGASDRKAPARFGWVERGSRADLDVRADKKRDEAIRKLKRLLPSLGEGSRKAELIFRLSEMYWAKSKFKHLRAMRVWDRRLDVWHRRGQKGSQPRFEEIPEAKQSDRYKEDAIGLYERISAEYPEYARTDEVLYNHGTSLYEMGKKSAAVAKFRRLIRRYPQSDFAADAWLQLGEHFFANNELARAVKAYGQAAETRKPRIYSFALYKLAWCDYNLGEYERALEKFRRVVNYAQENRQQGQSDGLGRRDRIQLLEESLSDMVRTYSHLDAVDDAFDYYRAVLGDGKAYKYLRRLAALYDSEGKYAAEIHTYRELNRRYPYADAAPKNQTAIMKAFAKLGKNDEVRREARRLIDLYAPNAVWAAKNEGSEASRQAAFEDVEEELAKLVTQQHAEAQKTKLTETYRLARDLYREYLEKFTESPNTYRFRFLYAEILFELKETQKAAEQYDRIVDQDPEGEFAKHAAYAAILAWEKTAAGVREVVGKKIVEKNRKKIRRHGAMKALEKLQKLKKGGAYRETHLSFAEQKLAAACDRFVRIAPDDVEVVKVKYKSARLYYIHNRFDEAAHRFGEIIRRWPKHALARVAAESIIESYNVREDWSGLQAWARRLSGHKLLMADRGFSQRVQQYAEGAAFNEIRYVHEPKEAPAAVGGRYLAFSREYPSSDFVPVALYNATVLFEKAGDLEQGLRASVLALEWTKKISSDSLQAKRTGDTLSPSALREKLLFSTGGLYAQVARYGEAAALYEKYAKEFRRKPRRPDALFNAGQFREALGAYERAIQNFTTYLQDYPQRPDSADLAWRVGRLLEKEKKYAHAERLFTDLQRSIPRAGQALRYCAAYRVLLMREAQKKSVSAAEFGQLFKEYSAFGPKGRSKSCVLETAGAAAFRSVEADYSEYLTLPLAKAPESQRNKNLLRKLKSLEELQNRYTEVLAVGHGDYGIAALYRIGVLYQHMSRELFDTPCPRALDEEQCMIYQGALQEKAFPLEEKAIEAFKRAQNKALDLGLYGKWLTKAQAALAGYQPGAFPPVRRFPMIRDREFGAPKWARWP